MNIIEGIKRYIAYQRSQGLQVHAMAFAMYPHQYVSICKQLISQGVGKCINDKAFSVDGVVVGFYQANERILNKTRTLEHDTEFNNIIYKP